jgi:hypothetical protein
MIMKRRSKAPVCAHPGPYCVVRAHAGDEDRPMQRGEKSVSRGGTAAILCLACGAHRQAPNPWSHPSTPIAVVTTWSEQGPPREGPDETIGYPEDARMDVILESTTDLDTCVRVVEELARWIQACDRRRIDRHVWGFVERELTRKGKPAAEIDAARADFFQRVDSRPVQPFDAPNGLYLAGVS